MTLLDRSASESFRERSLPVLATERLILRAPCFEDAKTTGGEMVFLIARRGGAVIGACGIAQFGEGLPEIGYWLGVPFWGQGYATEAVRAVIDHAFEDLGYDVVAGGARVSNPASRRVLEKCGFQWTGVGLYRIRALASSAPVDRFRLDRRRWAITREDRRKRP